MRNSWIFILTVLLLASCADLNRAEQLERVDALQTKVQEFQAELERFDEDAWTERMNTAAFKVEQLKQLESDTIPLEDAYKIDTYRIQQMAMPSVFSIRNNCLTQLKEMEKRLKKLRKDIEQGNGKRHKYDSYIHKEETLLKELEAGFTNYKNEIEQIESEMPAVEEEIDRILRERIREEAV